MLRHRLRRRRRVSSEAISLRRRRVDGSNHIAPASLEGRCHVIGPSSMLRHLRISWRISGRMEGSG